MAFRSGWKVSLVATPIVDVLKFIRLLAKPNWHTHASFRPSALSSTLSRG